MTFNSTVSILPRTQTIASFLFFLITHSTEMRSCYTYCYIPCFCLFVCIILCSKSQTTFHANTHISTACFLREGHVELCHACLFHNLINQSPAVGTRAASTFMLLIASPRWAPRKSELWIQWFPLTGFYLHAHWVNRRHTLCQASEITAARAKDGHELLTQHLVLSINRAGWCSDALNLQACLILEGNGWCPSWSQCLETTKGKLY